MFPLCLLSTLFLPYFAVYWLYFHSGECSHDDVTFRIDLHESAWSIFSIKAFIKCSIKWKACDELLNRMVSSWAFCWYIVYMEKKIPLLQVFSYLKKQQQIVLQNILDEWLQSLIHSYCKNSMERQTVATWFIYKGIGEGGAGGGTCLPTFKSGGGGHKSVCAPHFWAEQMFLLHYLLIFCG